MGSEIRWGHFWLFRSLMDMSGSEFLILTSTRSQQFPEWVRQEKERVYAHTYILFVCSEFKIVDCSPQDMSEFKIFLKH